jgi:hypothetical protein
VVQALARLAAGFLAQEQLEVGIVLAQPRQDARQHERRDRRDHAHPHLARKWPPGGARDIGELVGLAQHAPRLFDEALAERREPHHAARALDQHHADQRLELANARRQRRLGDETGLGGAAEMAMIAQRDQILQLLERGEIGASH